MTTLYAILPRSDWDGTTPVHEHGGAIFVAAERLHETVNRFCLRDALSYPSVMRELQRRGSVFCAGKRTALAPAGVLVGRVDNPRAGR